MSDVVYCVNVYPSGAHPLTGSGDERMGLYKLGHPPGRN
jgi:hypothetical protein